MTFPNKTIFIKFSVKTLELLFKGAKKPNTLYQDVNREPLLKPIAIKDTMRQLIISKDGKLQHSETIVSYFF